MKANLSKIFIILFLFYFAGILSQDSGYKENKVEVDIDGFMESIGGGITVILKEKKVEDPRYLPIVIGSCEAISLREYLQNINFPRPLTYSLFSNVLKKLNVKILGVVISELEGSTYKARIIFQTGNDIWWEDARPSDGINMAIRNNAPIFVMENLLMQSERTKINKYYQR